MPRSREEILEERRRLRAEYETLFDAVAALLFRHDPVGINFEGNTDEYEPEARAILTRLRHCNSSSDVQRVTHEEFVLLFNASIAGAEEHYKEIASEIWNLWQRYLDRCPSKNAALET